MQSYRSDNGASTQFLNQWEEGAKIGELSLFYDQESDYVVLNKDNDNFLMYLNIVEQYLSLSEKSRKDLFLQKINKSTEEEITVLNNALVHRKIAMNIKYAMQGYIPEDDQPVVFAISERDSDTFSVACTAYLYGVMCGKRAERARRKE